MHNSYSDKMFLETIKEKLPEEYYQNLIDGIYIGLKASYKAYLKDKSGNRCKYNYFIFAKDTKIRVVGRFSNKLTFQGSYKKSGGDMWVKLCAPFTTYKVSKLTVAMRRSLFNYIKEHEIIVEDFFDEYQKKNIKIFYFDNSNEIFHTSVY